MVVGIKDTAKLIGISIIICCAVLVCTMFLNYLIDISSLSDGLETVEAQSLYEAQVSTAKVICCVSGGCLLATSVIMLLFYIKLYIDTHKKELGILKALGYSSFQIAKNFWTFGFSVLLGGMVGFSGAYLLMPAFYDAQNSDGLLPEITVQFHPLILFAFILLPTFLFSATAILYAYLKLKQPALRLLLDTISASVQGFAAGNRWSLRFTSGRKRKKEKSVDADFLTQLKKNTLREKKSLVFFIVFASFCFSSMTQMSFSMNDLASPMMAVMMLLIGMVLACTTLFLSITTVVRMNTRTIAMMRVFGYSQTECCHALLSGYRPVSYFGFVLGTAYQYGLLRLMLNIVFRNVEITPKYEFDVSTMLISLACFAVLYELTMYCYSERIKKISLKEIMLE